jgi:hypothetical protein
MKGPLDIHQFLLAHDVHHEIVRLPRTAAAAASLAEALGLPPRRCVAVHPFRAVTATGDVLVLVLAPSDAVLTDDAIAAQLCPLLRAQTGTVITLEPAAAGLVSSHTDYLAGHLAPLLLPADVIVVALQSLADLAASVVYTPTGDAGTALGLRALDLLVLTRATVLPDHVGARTRRRPVKIDLGAPESFADAATPLDYRAPVSPAARKARTPQPARAAEPGLAASAPVAS